MRNGAAADDGTGAVEVTGTPDWRVAPCARYLALSVPVVVEIAHNGIAENGTD
ncbi:hypothetical protein GJR88_04920 [Dietzia sp. DQ12-45-1b]|nr:hypothetical protein GJR88_04920 [Dietzia sp. DQ12-45-1b]